MLRQNAEIDLQLAFPRQLPPTWWCLFPCHTTSPNSPQR